MIWAKVFVVFFVTHQFGDYLLQTEWQAMTKQNGLGSDPNARRALFSHTFTYSLAYVPAFIWIAQTWLGWRTLWIAAVVILPHLIQDDRRLLGYYMRRVKGMDPTANWTVAALVDQAAHMVALFGAALLVSALS